MEFKFFFLVLVMIFKNRSCVLFILYYLYVTRARCMTLWFWQNYTYPQMTHVC